VSPSIFLCRSVLADHGLLREGGFLEDGGRAAEPGREPLAADPGREAAELGREFKCSSEFLSWLTVLSMVLHERTACGSTSSV